MKFCAIASGSSGNCIYVGHGNVHILVDAGISGKRIEEGLAQAGVDPSQIQAILITHEHSDHIQGATVFASRFGCPVYGTEKTLEFISKAAGPRFDRSKLHPVNHCEDLFFGGIRVHVFRLSHDALDPVGYTFEAEERKLSIATDTGCFDDRMVEALSNSDVLYVEANHDENMLMLGSYPYQLKLRIRSELGHLSNDACAELISRVRCERTHTVVLAHVSKENNFEELAYETVRLSIESDEAFTNVPRLIVAKRNSPSELITI